MGQGMKATVESQIRRIPVDTFGTLCSTDISEIPPEGWADYDAQMQPWLTSGDAHVRGRAVGRLVMAVFWAEPMSILRRDRSAVDDALAVARLDWLLQAIGDAHARHADIIPIFLKTLHHHGDRPPFAAPLTAWLTGIQAAPPAGVDPEQAMGLRLLVQPFETWPEMAASLLPFLDHPASYPRACAARRLGDCAYAQVDPAEQEVIALVVEKELARPGVLGPFQSTRHDFTTQHDTASWLLDILERRNGWPPADMPFNDIDFYLHELCSTSPHLVRRMLDNGFEHLAYLTATEHSTPIDGMEPLLRELTRSADPHIAGSAARHLANQYGPAGPQPHLAPHPRP